MYLHHKISKISPRILDGADSDFTYLIRRMWHLVCHVQYLPSRIRIRGVRRVNSLGWSDLALIAISKMDTYKSIFRIKFQKIGKIGPAFTAKFSFSNITGTLKMNMFCESLPIPSFYFKEQSKKKIKNQFEFVKAPKVFWPGQVKSYFFAGLKGYSDTHAC